MHLSLSRAIILVFNNSLLMFLSIVFITKFHEWEQNLMLVSILVSLSVITLVSIFGSYIKNKWGWLFSVLPTFSVLSIILLVILPNQEHITWQFLAGLFITANFLIALFNTKTYQLYFHMKRTSIIIMNLLAVIIAVLYKTGLMYFVENY